MSGQTSIEFMVFAILLLAVMTVATVSSLSAYNSMATEGVNNEAKAFAEQVATEINIAAGVGDGYSRNFTLPATFDRGTDYNMIIMNQRVYINWAGRNYSLPLLTYNVTGNLKKGGNLIRNTNGVISID